MGQYFPSSVLVFTLAVFSQIFYIISSNKKLALERCLQPNKMIQLNLSETYLNGKRINSKNNWTHSSASTPRMKFLSNAGRLTLSHLMSCDGSVSFVYDPICYERCILKVISMQRKSFGHNFLEMWVK